MRGRCLGDGGVQSSARVGVEAWSPMVLRGVGFGPTSTALVVLIALMAVAAIVLTVWWWPPGWPKRTCRAGPHRTGAAGPGERTHRPRRSGQQGSECLADLGGPPRWRRGGRPPGFDAADYLAHHAVERGTNRLKHNRTVATR